MVAKTSVIESEKVTKAADRITARIPTTIAYSSADTARSSLRKWQESPDRCVVSVTSVVFIAFRFPEAAEDWPSFHADVSRFPRLSTSLRFAFRRELHTGCRHCVLAGSAFRREAAMKPAAAPGRVVKG